MIVLAVTAERTGTVLTQRKNYGCFILGYSPSEQPPLRPALVPKVRLGDLWKFADVLLGIHKAE